MAKDTHKHKLGASVLFVESKDVVRAAIIASVGDECCELSVFPGAYTVSAKESDKKEVGTFHFA